MVIFDIDGTLTLTADRAKKYLKKGAKDWEGFLSHCGEDPPNRPIIKVFKALTQTGEYIKMITGRDERWREITQEWLLYEGISIMHRDLHMRKADDNRDDVIIKTEIIQPFKDQIEMVFEDRASVVKMWRDLGITCLQVDWGDF